MPSFIAAHAFDAGGHPQSVAVADFNGDGINDLVVANYTSDGGVSVLLGNGDGSFQSTCFGYIAGRAPGSMAVADFNGDGFPDVAVAYEFSDSVSILVNDAIWPTTPGGRTDHRSARAAEGQGFRPNVVRLAVVAESQWLAAAFHIWQPSAATVAGVEPSPTLTLPTSPLHPTVATSALRLEEVRSPTQTGPIAVAPPRPILDLIFADTEATNIPGRLVDDRGLPLA